MIVLVHLPRKAIKQSSFLAIVASIANKKIKKEKNLAHLTQSYVKLKMTENFQEITHQWGHYRKEEQAW